MEGYYGMLRSWATVLELCSGISAKLGLGRRDKASVRYNGNSGGST
jgi:hypothetical protein